MLRRNSMRRGLCPLVWGLSALFFLWGCSNSPGGNDGGFDGCQGGDIKLLSVVGNPNRLMYPGDEEKLQVVLLEKCVGVVTGESVNFEIRDNPGDSSLDAAQAKTADTGPASVNLFGGLQTGSFQVWAHHPVDPEGVYFSINLRPMVRDLSAVGPKDLECYLNDSVEMSVKVLDLHTNNPARDVMLRYAIVPPSPGDASVPTPQVATNVSGQAAALFQCGTAPVSYQVKAEGAGEQIGAVTFNIQVKSRPDCVTTDDCPPGAGYICVSGACRQAGGEECENSDQCPPGYECRGGFCRPEGTLPDSCEISDDCPAGYYCEGHECYPCPEDSTRPECNEGPEGCLTDADCPPGFICRNGVCYPDNEPETPLPELGGTWYTSHFFDLEDAMGGASTHEIIRMLNEIVNFCGDLTGIGFVDDMICDLVDEYIPDWVGTLIRILANLVEMMSELRAEGRMELTHLNPPELISGTEEWNTVLIQFLEACCNCGGDPGDCCNPYDQPNYPDCATIDITRQELSMGDVGLEVLPFTGKIHVDESSNPVRYTLLIDSRKVRIEYSKFMRFVVDLLVQIFTDYDSLEDALEEIIDCQAIQDVVDDLLGTWAPNIIPACQAFIPVADDLLGLLLDQIGMDWKLLEFTGPTSATVAGADPPYGIQLGHKQNHTALNRHCDGFCDGACSTCDGSWSGDVTLFIDGDLEGSWYAVR